MHERMRETLKILSLSSLRLVFVLYNSTFWLKSQRKDTKKDLCQLRPFSAHSVSDFKEVFKRWSIIWILSLRWIHASVRLYYEHPPCIKVQRGENKLLFHLSFANTPAYFQQAPLHSRADVVLSWLTKLSWTYYPLNKSCQPTESVIWMSWKRAMQHLFSLKAEGESTGVTPDYTP